METVKKIKRMFKQLEPTIAANLSMDMYIRSCLNVGMSEREIMAEMRRNVKCMAQIWAEHAEAGLTIKPESKGGVGPADSVQV
jgi:hypothetical protein